MAILSEGNLDKSILYEDLPISSISNVNGNIQSPINSEALAQAIKIWLASAKGEKIRSPKGGWLIPLLAKPMTNEVADKIRGNVLTGLSTEFSPPITVTDLQVIPDYNNKRWVISISGYNAGINIGVNTYAVFNAGV